MEDFEEITVGFDVAKSAKQFGFRLKCKDFYGQNDKSYYQLKENVEYTLKDYNDPEGFSPITISAPSQAVLQRWFRKVHGLSIDVTPNHIIKMGQWCVDICDITNGGMPVMWSKGDPIYCEYEYGMEGGFREAFKILERRKNGV